MKIDVRNSLTAGFSIVLLLFIGGCRSGLEQLHYGGAPVVGISICHGGAPIAEICTYSYSLSSNTRSAPTAEQIKQSPYRSIVVDKKQIEMICKKLSELDRVECQSGVFDLRAICEIEYSNKRIDVIDIDSHGRVRCNGVIFEDSYSLLLLLGVLCINSE